jgi:hypothetical protein
MKNPIRIAVLTGSALLFTWSTQAADTGHVSGLSSLFQQAATKKRMTRSVKPGLGLKSNGGKSRIQDNCVADENGNTHCDDCDVDWDQQPPAKFCITNAICYNASSQRVDCDTLP